MRVCHVCSGHSVDDERVFLRACCALAEAGYDVHLLATGKRSEPYVDRGVTIHPLPVCRSRRERLARSSQVARRAAALKPDLFHVHEPDLLGPTVARAGTRPVIWDVHESYLDVLMDRPWIPRWLRIVAREAWDRQERRLLRRCAGVVAVTEWVADRYRPLHRRVQVIANFPDFPELRDLPPASRDGQTCVFAGTILPNRGLSQTFQALALLKERDLPVQLNLAGGGGQEYLDTLWAEADRLGIRSLVTYHGFLSRPEALLLMNRSSIGLVPHQPWGNTLYGIPVKMVEYMGLGLPLVYVDVPSHHEIAGASGAGIAVDATRPAAIADAIERLVRNPALARQMGEAGRRAVRERLNWNSERAKLLSFYQDLLGRSARDRQPEPVQPFPDRPAATA